MTLINVEHPGRGTPDEAPLQRALDAARDAGGGHVMVGAGTWHVTHRPLRIHARTRLTLSPATTVRRSGPVDALLCNGPRDGSDTYTRGYDGPGDITVEGGIWDVNLDEVPNPSWGLVFAHARHVTVQDLEVRHVPEWHAIELNSTFDGLVRRCRFVRDRPRAVDPWNGEAVSVDLALEGLRPFGAGDDTQSRRIRVLDNYCQGWQTFCGAHTGIAGSSHSDIIIADNIATGLSWWGVHLKNASRVVVKGNVFTDVGGGVWIRAAAEPERTRPLYGVVVTGNVIDVAHTADGIRIEGLVAGHHDGRVHGASVMSNTVRDAKASGVLVERAPGVQLASNLVDGAGGVGVELRECDHAVVTGNLIRASGGNGVLVKRAHRLQLSTNTVVDPTGDAAVRLDGVRQASVHGNLVSVTGDLKPACALTADAGCADLLCADNDVRGGYREAPFALAGAGDHDWPGNTA